MDIAAALITGIDIPFPEAQLIIHQPTAKEIAYLGEKDFFTGIQLLCFNKSMIAQGENVLGNQSDFQILMTVMSEKEAEKQKECVISVLEMIFPNQRSLITPRAFVIGDKMIDDNNFNAFQNLLKDIFCLKSQLSQQGGYNPADKRAKEIADKLAKAKEKIAKQKGETDTSFINQYVSILAVGLQQSVLETSKYTLYQIFDQVERFGLYTAWDIDIKAKMAGATGESKVDNWMKNLH